MSKKLKLWLLIFPLLVSFGDVYAVPTDSSDPEAEGTVAIGRLARVTRESITNWNEDTDQVLAQLQGEELKHAVVRSLVRLRDKRVSINPEQGWLKGRLSKFFITDIVGQWVGHYDRCHSLFTVAENIKLMFLMGEIDPFNKSISRSKKSNEHMQKFMTLWSADIDAEDIGAEDRGSVIFGLVACEYAFDQNSTSLLDNLLLLVTSNMDDSAERQRQLITSLANIDRFADYANLSPLLANVVARLVADHEDAIDGYHSAAYLLWSLARLTPVLKEVQDEDVRTNVGGLVRDASAVMHDNTVGRITKYIVMSAWGMAHCEVYLNREFSDFWHLWVDDYSQDISDSINSYDVGMLKGIKLKSSNVAVVDLIDELLYGEQSESESESEDDDDE